MTVLFRNSIEGGRFLNVWNAAKSANSGVSLHDMDQESYGSKILGYTLADANATDFALRFDREFFAANYDRIIDSHETLGTMNTIIYLAQAALGFDAVVTLESPNPAHLIIHIQEPSKLGNAATLVGEQIITKSGDKLMFKATTSEYTLNQVETMLRSIEAAGVYIEYNFIEAE
ncbi:hypothetical protein NVP1259O_22 [Vibrio phage 1.259.O._10N.286.48.F4]|nr:hypothetical protein NVP1259O_22 [Vibrio phage 1.259.O._10N.286.48.F4]